MSIKVTKIKDLTEKGDTSLYRLTKEIPYEALEKSGKTSFVIVSTISGPWTTETYIFPATEEGEILSWPELPGSFRGSMGHEEALKGFIEAFS